MKLLQAQVHRFRNILDSGEVDIDPLVTCLVGKNESGKTGFLEALRRVNPAPTQGSASLVIQKHYPAWREKADRQKENLDDVVVVRAVFDVDEQDRAAFVERFGEGVLNSDTITVKRKYSGGRNFDVIYDEPRAIVNAIEDLELPSGVASQVRDCKSFAALTKLIASLHSENQDPNSEVRRSAAAIQSAVASALGDHDSFWKAVVAAIDERLPYFFYFSNYSTLPGRVKIEGLLEADPANLDQKQQTAVALLRLGGTEDAYLLNPDYESRKRELENIANYLTDDVLQYWSQNPDLRVMIDISQETVKNQQGQHSVLHELKIRLDDAAHRLSLPFDERSSGFQWFFSFMAAFSQYENSARPLVILLDEPALALHARAQRDFLRFIDERLAGRHQVVYTTHSPFMIEPGQLQRVRVVEDRGKEVGSVISADVLSTDRDTLFPLQGALGYDLVQHLLIGPNNLLVEGPSDHTYLTVISDFLKEQGRTGLDDRWSVTFAGGADNLPTFVALLGGKRLDMTVLVDSRKDGHQKLASLAKDGYLANRRIVMAGEAIKKPTADIEDLFDLEDYLGLYNSAFGARLTVASLKGGGRMVQRVARAAGLKEGFNHRRPADVLLRHRHEILPTLRESTLTNFEALFARINVTLGDESE